MLSQSTGNCICHRGGVDISHRSATRLCRSYPSLQWRVSELYLQFETLNYCCKHFKRLFLFLFTGICLCERTHVCVGDLRGQKRVLDAMELERGWLQSAPHGCEDLVGSSERAVCILSLWVASPAHWCKHSIEDFLNTLYVLNLPSGYTYQCYVITIPPGTHYRARGIILFSSSVWFYRHFSIFPCWRPCHGSFPNVEQWITGPIPTTSVAFIYKYQI